MSQLNFLLLLLNTSRRYQKNWAPPGSIRAANLNSVLTKTYNMHYVLKAPWYPFDKLKMLQVVHQVCILAIKHKCTYRSQAQLLGSQMAMVLPKHWGKKIGSSEGLKQGKLSQANSRCELLAAYIWWYETEFHL